MTNSGPDAKISSLDNERDLSGMRAITYAPSVRSLASVVDAQFCDSLQVEHIRGGGVSPQNSPGPTEISRASLDVLQAKQHKHGQARRMDGYTLYLKEHVAPEWRRTQQRTENMSLVVRSRGRDRLVKQVWKRDVKNGDGKNLCWCSSRRVFQHVICGEILKRCAGLQLALVV